MDKRHNDHPDPDQLIRYANGELSPRESAHVGHHLESCWECRTEVEDTISAIGRYVHYRRNTLQPGIPPPKDWSDLTGDFARIRSEHRASVERQRPAWIMSLLHRPRVAAAVGTILVLSLVVLLDIPRSQSAQAAALIEKAVEQERNLPTTITPAALILVKTREGNFTRRGDLSDAGLGQILQAEENDLANRIEGRFRSARYSWSAPLSAISYSEWREGLPNKHDSLSARKDDGAQELVAVQTSTTSGVLSAVTLVLRKSDLHPVRCEFHFHDGDQVEISEAAAPAPMTSPHQPQRLKIDVRSSDQAKGQSQPEVLVGSADELHVLAALHRIGADAGDSLFVTLERSRIVVSGLGIKQERQAQIEAALRTVPHVAVEFSESQGAQVILQPSPSTTERPAALTFGRKIEDQLGGTAAMEVFSNSLLRATETLLLRAHALRQLGERFPPDVEQQFNANDKAILNQIREDHGTALTRAADEIQGSLSPILAKLGVKVRTPSPPIQTTWQSAAANVLTAGQRFDRVLSNTLAPTTGTEDESGELGDALGALQAAVASLRNDRR